jgi:hypothetical protein
MLSVSANPGPYKLWMRVTWEAEGSVIRKWLLYGFKALKLRGYHRLLMNYTNSSKTAGA